ncbi:MAG: large ribosomal subunit protein bL35 [Planctomycetota bacterium]|jgi:large subunit ribosomal protein L35
MPKMKGHKGLAKRVKLTGTGKPKRRRCCGSHLMSGKNAKRRRRIGSTDIITGPVAKTVKARLSK